MANEREIKITISADGSAAITSIGNVGSATEKLANTTGSALNRLKENWMAVAGGATAAYLALQKVWDSMQGAAETMEAFGVLEKMTSRYNMTAEELASRISQASMGLIGMGSSAKIAAEGMAKGLTPEMLENIAKWAPALDQINGSISTSKEAFEALVRTIASGRERAFVQLIGASADLKAETEGLSSKMTRAQKAVELYNIAAKRMADLQASLGSESLTAKQRMEVFNNSLDQMKFFLGQVAIVVGGPLMAAIHTMLSMVYAAISGFYTLGEAVGTLTDAMGLTDGLAARSAAAAEKWGTRWATQANAAANAMKGAVAAIRDFGQYTPSGAGAGPPIDLSFDTASRAEEKAEEAKFTKMSAIRYKTALAYQKWYQDILAGKLKFLNDSKAIDDKESADTQESMQKMIGALSAYYAESQRLRDEENAKKAEAYLRSREIEEEQRRLLFESRSANIADAFGAIGGSEFAQNLNKFSALQEGQDPYQQEYDRWAALQDQKIMAMEQYGASEAEIRDAYRQYDIQQEQTQTQQKIQMAATSFGMMASLASAAYAASNQKNLAAFRAMQAMRIGEATMNTYSAAIGAYNAMVGIPYVGPILAVIAAAAAVAFGMMQVRAIASAKPGGGASSTSIPGAVSLSSASTPGGIALPEKEEATKTVTPVVNVHIYGNVVDHDAFARELTPALTKAWADGAR